MPPIRFDHFITYTSAANIDDYLKEYAAQGFAPYDQTVRHDPGLRNGFISFGPDYIEFCWVEDETLFAAGDAEHRALRTALRPFGLGLVADSVQAVHDDWTARGYSVPAVVSKASRDDTPDTPPVWSFQEIPGELLPGVSCFVLTYHTRPKDDVRKIRIAPNTSYAISGVTFVAPEPEARATNWRDLLAPDQPVTQSKGSFDVAIGPHRAMWMTPDAYHATYGLRWMPAPHPYGELALLHLLAADLGTVQTMLEQAGRQTMPLSGRGEEALLVEPDARDGFTFVIRQRPVEAWLRERVAESGEKLEIEAPA